MFKFESKSLEDTKDFAKNLSKFLIPGNVISLIGEMGSGKTTFTQYLLKNLGVEDYITSPTFSLVNSYEGKYTINHMDLYRLEDESEMETLDIDNLFYPEGITIIEWAERAKSYLPRNLIEIYIDKTSLEGRRFEIRGNNREEIRLIKELQ
ncbi:tRNA (adenosine(37)-N6)-threonylcarbamoyltransferase complex ATPase subunit type 1 TsaE [Lagierella sp.]|uniref:tRNA (adenosine(37)-N6)-threonylcarbamoyltransferase complex ATPase subunit type 1 TsaE n=1 Tax=Lagierella sp. TaxID=2849657 RepID=UPI00262AD2E5|nr:tRNA (adenosine(37)-N6)-threonylcarbamoyltransferase complex ATPase subunit type 1 TsaE [Lagierella sp.]